MLNKIKEFLKEATNAFRAHSIYMQELVCKSTDNSRYMEEMLRIARKQQAPISKEVIDANRRYDIAKTILPKTIIYAQDENFNLIDQIDYEQSVKDALALADELIKRLNE